MTIGGVTDPRRPGTVGVHEDDLVTGDAVALRVPVAGPGTRILSGLVDCVVLALLMLACVWALSPLLEELDEALGAAVVVVTLVLVLVVVPVAVETLSGGRSLGRLITGTSIVRLDGGPVALRQSVARALVGFLEVWATSGAVAITAVVLSRRGQRLGDMVAGTCCVRDRMRLQLPPPLPAVPHLEEWARAADLAPLPESVALGARQLLQRRDALSPEARAQVAADLATRVAARVHPQPPAGTHPEDLLQAVLVERARRDGLRLERERALRERLHLAR